MANYDEKPKVRFNETRGPVIRILRDLGFVTRKNVEHPDGSFWASTVEWVLTELGKKEGIIIGYKPMEDSWAGEPEEFVWVECNPEAWFYRLEEFPIETIIGKRMLLKLHMSDAEKLATEYKKLIRAVVTRS